MVGVEFTYTDANGIELGVLHGVTLDMAWGIDENDFELKMGLSPQLVQGALVYCDETEWGGVIDQIKVDETGDNVEVTYTGRTWHGIFASHILCPESGQAYLAYNHDPHVLLQIIIDNAGLSDLFEVGDDETLDPITGRFYRYMNAWDALKIEFWRHGLRMDFKKKSGGKVVVQPLKATDYSGEYYSDQFSFEVEQELTHVNHLIALGSGELGSREVVHLYADAQGNVSTTKSIYGVLERTEVYETSATDKSTDTDVDEDETLTGQATAKLKELQADGDIDITIAETLNAHVGDLVAAHSVNTPASVTGTVNKIVLNIDEKGVATISYEVGNLVEDEEEIA